MSEAMKEKMLVVGMDGKLVGPKEKPSDVQRGNVLEIS